MGIDEKRVRAQFIQLLRARDADHPWVRTHDRKVAEHVAIEGESITDLIERICCDRCPMGLSCATQSWCYLESRELGERARRAVGGAEGGRVRVLVACEFSGVVRDAFTRRGHDAMSCDLVPSETPGPHHVGDVRDLLRGDWDLLIAHPPCTHLAASGARWWAEKAQEQAEALAFVRLLLDAPIPRIALENPVSLISTRIRKPDQIIQPHHFGHGETKTTCLWLKNLPPLFATHLVPGREARIHRMPQSPTRGRERSRTYPGIAEAFAMQWGGVGCRQGVA